MTALQKQLFRQLEASLRGCRTAGSVRDIRWQLTQTGLTRDQVWAVELRIRRLIRSERAGHAVVPKNHSARRTHQEGVAR
ncbi:hypothetical protein [Streptomyces sp. NPDC055105]|uniref:hypothetical protein n=1 Tax=Streptomyces sp. NPDC055105 TaxID=3365719 RepID=UPI0037D269AC